MRSVIVLVLLSGCALLDAAGSSPATVIDGPAIDSPDDAPTDTAPVGKRFWRLVFVSHDETSGGGSAVLTEIELEWDGTAHGLGAQLSTTDLSSLINPHPDLTSLTDNNFTAGGGSSYTSVFDNGTIDIDLGAPEPVTAVLIAPSGFNSSAPSKPPLEWTLRQFQLCSSDAAATAPFVCHDFDGGARTNWTDATLRRFAL